MAKILLVEDDKSLREIYGVRLQAEGYTIVSAGDGEEALALAIKERPDLIVSDVMMPKISGFDMLDILRSTSETKDVKVIMMTALSSDDQRARGEALGADRYLVKSQVGIEDVVRTVHDVLADGLPGAGTQAATTFPSIPAPTAVGGESSPLPSQPPVTATPEVMPTATPAPAVPPMSTATPAEPATTPVISMPTPAPVADTAVPTAPAATPAAPTPAAPAMDPIYAQTAPVVPAQPLDAAALAPLPAPAAPVAPVVPVVAAPVQPAPAVTAPAAAPLPQPTAPFSSPAPASLGQRVIEPLTPVMPEATQPLDIAAQMQQALSGTPQPPVPPAGTPPVAPLQ